MGKEYRKAKSIRPEIMFLNQNDLLAKAKLLAWLDLKCVSMKEINLLGGEDYVSVCEKDGKFQGLCIWFAVEFPDGSELSTGPSDEKTHWKQTAIVLPTDKEVLKYEPVAFRLKFEKDALNSRCYNIQLMVLNAEEIEHDVPCNCHLTKCIVTKAYIESQSSKENI